MMDIITTVRTSILAATLGVASLTLSSCGDELKPPAQDIGVEQSEPEPTTHYEPACNTPASVRPCPDWNRPGRGTRNRMDFNDEFEPGR
jgi:hypothetical protein